MTPPNSCTSAFCVLTIIITIILFSLPVDAIAAQSAIGLFYLQFDDSYRCLDCTVYALDSLAAWYSDRDIPWVDTVLVEPDLDNSPEITIDELIYCIGPKLLAYRDLVVIHSHGIGGPPEFCGGFAAEYYLNWAMCDYKIGVRQTQCNLPEGYLQLCEVKQRELGEWVHVAWAICLSADCIRDYITPYLHDDCAVIAACCSSLCGANAWYKCKEMLGYAEEEDLLKGCADIHTALGHLACDDPAIPNTLEGAMEGTNFGRAELGRWDPDSWSPSGGELSCKNPTADFPRAGGFGATVWAVVDHEWGTERIGVIGFHPGERCGTVLAWQAGRGNAAGRKLYLFEGLPTGGYTEFAVVEEDIWGHRSGSAPFQLTDKPEDWNELLDLVNGAEPRPPELLIGRFNHISPAVPG